MDSKMPRQLRIATLLLSTMGIAGCSVFMAANQPGYKNVEIIRQGTYRTQMINEFGAPVKTTKNPDGTVCDIFSFTQGYSGGAKTVRAITHGLADLFTLGLWEVIGTPSELVFTGNNVSYQTCYSKDETITTIVLLTPENDGRGRPPVDEAYDPSNSTPLQQTYIKQKTTIDQSNGGVATSEPPSTATTLTGSPKQKLMELEGLRKEGLITDTEYQKQRKEVLERY